MKLYWRYLRLSVRRQFTLRYVCWTFLRDGVNSQLVCGVLHPGLGNHGNLGNTDVPWLKWTR